MLIVSSANTASANNVHFNVPNKNRVLMLLLVNVSQIKLCIIPGRGAGRLNEGREEAKPRCFYEDYSWKCQQGCM